jgi:signal transduction histidine kinase/CheY-like chemotaxis protein
MAITALAAAVFFFDISMPLGVAGGVPYVVLVLAGLWFPGSRPVLWLAGVGTVLTIAGYFLSDPAGTQWMVLTNRGLALFAIWATAGLAYQRIRSDEKNRQREQMLNLANQANRGKSRFLAAASHDLRQPLQSTGIYLSVLMSRLNDKDPIEIAEKMRQSLDGMGEILDALLDISKLDSGAVVPEIVAFPIQNLLDRVASSMRPQAEEKGLALNIEASHLVGVSDLALLQRIVENFVSNAVRYTESGEMDVKCRQVDNVLHIDVSDTGPGIPQEAIDSVFEEYFRLENRHRDRSRGLGLGLSVVKHIARLLDHDLDVKSELGRGSVFSVSLPHGVQAVESVPSPAEEETGASDRCISVLFVDDDPAIVDATMLMMEGAGFAVRTAFSGDEALAHINKGVKPDILVSDFHLPGYNGAEVVRRVRQLTRENLPGLIMTGDTSTDEIQDENLSYCKILQKPVNPDHFIKLIRNTQDDRGAGEA